MGDSVQFRCQYIFLKWKEDQGIKFCGKTSILFVWNLLLLLIIVCWFPFVASLVEIQFHALAYQSVSILVINDLCYVFFPEELQIEVQLYWHWSWWRGLFSPLQKSNETFKQIIRITRIICPGHRPQRWDLCLHHCLYFEESYINSGLHT